MLVRSLFLALALSGVFAVSSASAQNTSVSYILEGVYRDPVAVGRPGSSGADFQVWATSQLAKEVQAWGLNYDTCTWTLLNNRRVDIQTDFPGNSTVYTRTVTHGAARISWIDVYVLSGRTNTWQAVQARRNLASCRPR